MRYLVLPVLSVLSLLTPSVGAQEPFEAVFDHANLFSKEKIAEADHLLLDVLRKHHFHVVLETFAVVPKEDHSRVERMKEGDLRRYLRDWAQKRAVAENIDGLYILICQEPRHMSVLPWPEAHDADFSEEDCERLRRTFVKNTRWTFFNSEKKKKANAALLVLVRQVCDHLDGVDLPKGEDANSLPWTTILAVVAGGLLSWLVLCLIRMRLNARSSEPVDDRDQVFLPARWGGMFGSLAGQWIYDTMFQQVARSAEAPPNPDGSPMLGSMPEPEKTPEAAPEETSATSTEH